ncbi:hypothetical protein HN51_046432 [Arachis hypogaea]
MSSSFNRLLAMAIAELADGEAEAEGDPMKAAYGEDEATGDFEVDSDIKVVMMVLAIPPIVMDYDQNGNFSTYVDFNITVHLVVPGAFVLAISGFHDVTIALGNAEAGDEDINMHPGNGELVIWPATRIGEQVDFSLCVLGNLCPETVEEAFAMVPSIKVRALFDDAGKQVDVATSSISYSAILF